MDTKSNDDSGGSDSLDKSMQIKCVMVETTSEASESAAEMDNCSQDSAALQQQHQQHEEKEQEPPPPGEPKTDANAGECSASFKLNSSNNNNNNITTTTAAASVAFETKVKMISQNLMETKLAETTTTSTNDTDVDIGDTTTTTTSEAGTATTTAADDGDDGRAKKVHFHPDVKQSDGGSSSIRRKKKWKSAQNRKSGKDAGPRVDCDDAMDMDDDDADADMELHAEEEEEVFSLARTIAEAEDYLKQHPLTFVRRVEEQNGEQSPRDEVTNNEDTLQAMDSDMLQVDDSAEDFYKNCKPENGIDRVLGRETKAGKVEFLLRYENQGGLFWESEEFIRRMCPNLLRAYEKNRERQQQRLMQHVAKRQSIRQRYTDF